MLCVEVFMRTRTSAKHEKKEYVILKVAFVAIMLSEMARQL